ncbi:MAG: hypothetical protein ABF586_09230 [Sporolactobacillus sp.]
MHKEFQKLKQIFDRKENIYRALAVVLVASYAFLFLSRLLLHVPDAAENTPLQTRVDTGEVTVQLTHKTFYTDQNLLELGLIIDPDSGTLPTGYAVKVAEKTNTQAHYRTQLIHVIDDDYQLFIHRLPAHWTDISVRIGPAGSSGLSDLSSSQTLYSSASSTGQKTAFHPQTLTGYAVQYYQFICRNDQHAIQKEAKKQARDRRTIRALKHQIGVLSEQASTQTGSDKTTTESTIQAYQSQIGSIQNAIQASRDRAAERREEIQLVLKKLKKVTHQVD